MKTRDSLHHRFLETSSETNWTEYKGYRNNVKRALMDVKENAHIRRFNVTRGPCAKCCSIKISKKKTKKMSIPKISSPNDFNPYFSSVECRAADAVAQLARENNITYLNSFPLRLCCPPWIVLVLVL